MREIETKNAPGHTGGVVPQAVESGGWVFVSALFGTTVEEGKIPDTPRAEAEQLFANLKAVLAAAGGTLENVVQVTITMRALQQDRPTFNEVWREQFGDHRPARSAIESSDFGRPGLGTRFMIQAVAHLAG